MLAALSTLDLAAKMTPKVNNKKVMSALKFIYRQAIGVSFRVRLENTISLALKVSSNFSGHFEPVLE